MTEEKIQEPEASVLQLCFCLLHYVFLMSEGSAQPVLPAVQTGNENLAVRGYTCQRLAEQLRPSPMAERSAGSVEG